VLGDPGAHDATIHAIQACIPHALILPIGLERLYRAARPAMAPLTVYAHERVYENNTFIYDVEVQNADGTVQAVWQGLRFRQVDTLAPRGTWVAPLLAIYCERYLSTLLPGATIAVRLLVSLPYTRLDERRLHTDQALQHALEAPVSIWRRPDGKPVVHDSQTRVVSAAHSAGLTLAIAAPGPVGCDMEVVSRRPAALWRDLLGPERYQLATLIAHQAGEDQDQAATRVWTASESLRKVGALESTPLVLVSVQADGWVLLAAGSWRLATLAAVIQGSDKHIVLAFAQGTNSNVEKDCACASMNTVT